MKTLCSFRRCILATLVLGLFGFAPKAGAQPPSADYSWYGEVVSFDQAAKTATVQLQTQPQVSSYAGDFKPGEKLVLVWAPILGEADKLLYVARADVMEHVDLGYILRAEFVSADTTANTLTVRIAAPDGAAAVLRGATAKWIKATMPKDQADGKGIAMVALSAKPNLKLPEPPPEEVAAAANATGPLSNIAGTWTVETSLGGNAIANECAFTQEGTTLTASCTSALGAAPLTGEVAGNTVKFSISADFMGTALELAFSGTVEPDGKKMSGIVSVFGMDSAFTGVKK